MADHTEYLPPTQFSKPNMFLVSIPNLATSEALVLKATKCFTMWASSFALCKNQFFAVFALAQVSAVVKVFEAIRNNVVSALHFFKVSAMWVPSTLDTK
ncbi:hypothetical protein OGATHE_002582 [Ogataea polymorpha]|uniref:Uncharacterized protein n=1 Tax=Ogataea polymorpha TaxID=460523 RepID=A0A9P8T902_9ASCO|nr:hypothetical protein OGATHE_002582 [Ogataea polymorpha]